MVGVPIHVKGHTLLYLFLLVSYGYFLYRANKLLDID